MTHETGGKIALITGANKGIGLEIARQLGQRGMRVLVGARNAERGQQAVDTLRRDKIDAHLLQLDVTDAASVAAAAQRIASEHGRLDILVNNAGAAYDWTAVPTHPSTVALDVARRTFETNFFGPLAVTQALLPLLRKSSAGRIVNMSSGLGSITEISNPASPMAGMVLPMYQASKAALNALTALLAKELRGTKLKVNSASPGWVNTDGGVPAWLREAMGGQVPASSVDKGADTPVWLATLPDDGPTGGFFDSRKPMAW